MILPYTLVFILSLFFSSLHFLIQILVNFFFLDEFNPFEWYPRFSTLFHFSTNDPYIQFQVRGIPTVSWGLRITNPPCFCTKLPSSDQLYVVEWLMGRFLFWFGLIWQCFQQYAFYKREVLQRAIHSASICLHFIAYLQVELSES